MVTAEGGFVAYLGTNDAYEVEKRALAGDEKCQMLVDAFTYQVSMEIARLTAVVNGKVDAILLTGGMARSEYLIPRLRERIDFLAPTYCFPGEDEMGALASNATAVLKGKTEAKEYK